MRVGTLVFSKAPFLHAVKRTSLPVRDENIRPPPTKPPPARSGPLSCNVSRPYKASADTPDASWEVLRAGAAEARFRATPPFTNGAAQCSDNMLTTVGGCPPPSLLLLLLP